MYFFTISANVPPMLQIAPGIDQRSKMPILFILKMLTIYFHSFWFSQFFSTQKSIVVFTESLQLVHATLPISSNEKIDSLE